MFGFHDPFPISFNASEAWLPTEPTQGSGRDCRAEAVCAAASQLAKAGVYDASVPTTQGPSLAAVSLLLHCSSLFSQFLMFKPCGTAVLLLDRGAQIQILEVSPNQWGPRYRRTPVRKGTRSPSVRCPQQVMLGFLTEAWWNRAAVPNGWLSVLQLGWSDWGPRPASPAGQCGP